MDIIFPEKSYCEWNKVEKPTVVLKIYERLNNEEEVEMDLTHNKNNSNNYNDVSNL